MEPTDGSAAIPTEFLRRAFERGKLSWPNISLTAEAFAAHLASKAADLDATALADLYVEDLFLACAVLKRLPAALATFDARILARTGQFVGRLDSSADFVEEVAQQLRVKLLVGSEGGEGRLGRFSGRGPLESWVCAAALRTAQDLIRARRASFASPQESFDVLAVSDDVELQLLRARYHDDFRQALGRALGALGPRERTMLRLYFLEQLTAAQIAKMYAVHETTALRWIERAREGVADQVREDLHGRLRLPVQELDELMVLLKSRLDVTVRRLLQTNQA